MLISVQILLVLSLVNYDKYNIVAILLVLIATQLPPIFERSKALVDELIIGYKSGEIDLFYFDESSFSLTPSVPYAWQKINEHIEVPCARSQTLNVLGFMGRNCQFESFIFEGAINTDVVISCFNEFAKNLSKTTIVLVDNAPTHTSKKFDKQTLEWCKQGLVVVPISRYSPELG